MLIDGLQCGHFTRDTFERTAQGRCRRGDRDLRLLGRHGRIARFHRPLARPGERQQGPGGDRHVGAARSRRSPRRAAPPSCSASRTPTCWRAVSASSSCSPSWACAPCSSPTTIRTSWRQLLRGRGFRPFPLRPGDHARDEPRRHPGRPQPCRQSHHAGRASISEKPVAVTHANPDSLFPHKRNKTDDVLKALRRAMAA